MEASASGGVFRSARDFIALGIEPQDAGKTLFIDALDEMRAGASDGRTALDQIRAKLKYLGRPRFRLSCREHDWRAQSDLSALEQVAPHDTVLELHLEPLSRGEQEKILVSRSSEVPDPQSFLRQADDHGLADLFGNPLLLDLAIRAVASKGGWPDSRSAIYDLACIQLAEEQSDAHREVQAPGPGDIDRRLDDAGMLCAILLLSGKSALTRGPSADSDLSTFAWHELPDALQLHDARAALASKIFVTVAGESTPRHRSIAEYLAAKTIARRLRSGLPLGRVLALMQGGDGITVEPLRGLHGWLTVHHVADRNQLIRLDPLTTILNGDASAFTGTDKRALLEALRDAAQDNPWFRNGQWTSYPFAALASPEMVDALAEVLSDHSTADANQALVDCVLDALNHGSVMPDLINEIEAWVMDPNAQFRNRIGAYNVWKRITPFDATRAREWLDRLHGGETPDYDARLASALLLDLYPAHLRPEEVLRFWPTPEAISSTAGLPHFWYVGLIEQTPPEGFVLLADSWLQVNPPSHHRHFDHEGYRLAGQILARALEQVGEEISGERLYAWLGIGTDEHGFSKLGMYEGARIARWLSSHADRLKAAMAWGWRQRSKEAGSNRRHFWEAENRLCGADRPADWLFWLLEVTASTADEELAKYCFSQVAARAVVDSQEGMVVPSMEYIINWVEANTATWPQAQVWLTQEWTCELADDWRANHHRQQILHELARQANRRKRQEGFAPYLEALTTGTPAPWLLNKITSAYYGRFTDIEGDSPEKRVQELLVSDIDTARLAVARVEQVLSRTDLPSSDEVFRIDAAAQYHHLRPAALLAAKMVDERNEQAVDTWREPLLSTLVAFWLTDGTGEMPGWYKRAVEIRPDEVAPLYLRYATPRLRRKGALMVTGLWALSREVGHAGLARLVLPDLLTTFPQRASAQSTRELNSSLLSALHLLDTEVASKIVCGKTEQASLDLPQRISWLVAGLGFSSDALARLVKIVGKSEKRIALLGAALHEQGYLKQSLKWVEPAVLSKLVELLALITRSELHPDGWVTSAHNRSDTMKALIGFLANDARPESAKEIHRLIELPTLQNWSNYLRYQLLSQQAAAREAFYAHPSPVAAAMTLQNLSPAGCADLQAFTIEHLRDIERHIRGTETFALKQFWVAMDGRRVPDSENNCRDLLLERLQLRLAQTKVTASSERRAAADKRADMRIEYAAPGRLIAVPIEVKKDNNESLWVAWQVQLQGLYSIDPAADGHGIYLVLWFGVKTRTSPEGNVPSDSADLERLLTARIPARDRAKLKVVVMDLTRENRRTVLVASDGSRQPTRRRTN
ncbi:MAG: hypothetical protein KXJ61_15195 [Hydrogenophaga sp.]|jgi:hypothetical protein|uniref:NACHT domain-containing protein n=1 Tax=Hydrogenophaga sp. TaxID=1904254 RepID=UPI001D526298|nr:hypothetical protein [Hydrogenophaga sp.]MBW0171565.1 hypothetical protein [Hydrogenophaga sp.]MBW0186210.1 hypothetical protein [Hydrogenophaga sp.]